MSIPSTGRATRKLTMRMLCDRYSICDRTVDRWTETGILPEPMRINNVRYWDEDEVEQCERQRMSAARQAKNESETTAA
jgi:predicted DNA-binding transcriptional regulator AlpA